MVYLCDLWGTVFIHMCYVCYVVVLLLQLPRVAWLWAPRSLLRFLSSLAFFLCDCAMSAEAPEDAVQPSADEEPEVEVAAPVQKKPAVKNPKAKIACVKEEPEDDDEKDDDEKPMKKPAAKAVLKKPAAAKGSGKNSGDKEKKAALKAAALKKAAAEKKKAEEKAKKEEKKRKREEELAKDWKSGIQVDDDEQQEGEKGEEEELDDDPCTDFGMPAEEKVQDNNKDRSKDYKFKAMYNSGQLPSWLAAEWEKTTKMKAGRQERQRELVNNAIDRKDNGKLMVNTDKPMFAELQARFLPSCFTLSTHVGFCVISTCTGSFLVCYMIYRAVSHCTIIGLYMSVIYIIIGTWGRGG